MSQPPPALEVAWPAGTPGRRSDDLVVLRSDAMRARLHPWALLGLWGWQALLALGASLPIASLVGATYQVGPRGDAPLWDPGGHALLDFSWHNARGLTAVTRAAESVLIVGAVAGLVPTTAAMIAIAHATRDERATGFLRSVAGAMRLLPSLLVLLAVVTAAQAAVLGVGVALGDGVVSWSSSALGEPRGQRLGVAVGLVFLTGASCLGVVHDLARAAVVCSRASGLGALVLGARAFTQAPVPLWWSWAWRALASLVPVVAVALVATRIGGRGGVALSLVALLHQAVILSRVALRASWLARALRWVRSAA
jgi:hypothetical protein